MKNLIKRFIVVGCLLIATGIIFGQQKLYAQKDFKGTITYSITYDGKVEPAVKAVLPKELEFKVFNNKTLTEVNQGGMSTTIIRDGDKKIIMTLMNIPSINKKYLIKTSTEEINKGLEKLPASTIKYLDETKEIAGVKCKKGQLITKDDEGKEVVSNFFYTEEFGQGDKNFDGPFKEVKWTLMEYQETQGEMIKNFVVTKVKKGKVSENDFLLPSGYEETTMEKLMEMFGGGGN